jgi:hypothetical protein
MIACFDAKYHYWFWRPYQAIPQAGTDGNPATVADPPGNLSARHRTSPNTPRRTPARAPPSSKPSTPSSAPTKVPFTLDSRVTGTTHDYAHLHDIVKDVDWARVLVGFHFRNSDLQGSNLGRKVGRYVTDNYFQPIGQSDAGERRRTDAGR